jgi:hypothetical protein
MWAARQKSTGSRFHREKFRLCYLLAEDFAEEHGQRIVELVDDTLLERDDGVVRDVNILGADFGAAFGDIAEADAEIVLEQRRAIEGVERMHFEAGDANEEARTAELFLFVVFAKDMADVLAKKTFDALPEFLDAIDVDLRNFPVGVRVRAEGGDFFVDSVVPGNVGDEVFDAREGFHGHDGDGLVHRQRVDARLACEARAAVDFRGAGTALGGFAVPAHGEIGREMALNVVESVEDDHAGGDGDLVVDGLAAGGAFAAEDS